MPQPFLRFACRSVGSVGVSAILPCLGRMEPNLPFPWAQSIPGNFIPPVNGQEKKRPPPLRLLRLFSLHFLLSTSPSALHPPRRSRPCLNGFGCPYPPATDHLFNPKTNRILGRIFIQFRPFNYALK